ncbi:MAG TPA: Gfo/Idh/MocA family oxidoreductase [Candidatus Didemnitutus sp.]|nr:Gfo/Idh/MocA family oxidoreductase [Candidatus Didemnitutus sp.]
MPRPVPAPKKSSRPAEPFFCAAAFLEHDHIVPMAGGLRNAGATFKWVFDRDPVKVRIFQRHFPEARAARSFAEILGDPQVALVAAAGVPCERGPTGLQVMAAGKDYFSDKAPFTSLAQLADARAAVRRHRRIHAVYYSERLHVKCALRADDLVRAGAIGRVVQVLGLGPHRLRASTRPAWFFRRRQYGGILCDIGSHQAEQFLFYAGASDARIMHAAVGNVANAATPELEDFGEASLLGNNGAAGYFRVDWLTPDGLRTWGDGRTVILGTEGYIELRKYIDVARSGKGDHLILVDQKGERRLDLRGPMEFPFFRQLIDDCRQRTETAMSQEHTFKAAEVALQAQQAAQRIGPRRELSERSSRRGD